MHGEKELVEKLGRNDPCPCGSARRFQTLLHEGREARWYEPRLLLLENRSGGKAHGAFVVCSMRFSMLMPKGLTGDATNLKSDAEQSCAKPPDSLPCKQ